MSERQVNYMDFGKLLGDSFGYTKDGLLGNPVTWILLIVLSVKH